MMELPKLAQMLVANKRQNIHTLPENPRKQYISWSSLTANKLCPQEVLESEKHIIGL